MIAALGLDPGPGNSAIVIFDGTGVRSALMTPNDEMLNRLRAWSNPNLMLVCEGVESFGMAVGKEVFETVFISGMFVQAWGGQWTRIYRRQVKQHLCHTARATDANIRQALIDRFGPIGTKKEPGVLYGVKSHCWAALAVAVTWWDLQQGQSQEELMAIYSRPENRK